MANDIIDINVYETTETVAITVQPNLTTINVNSITSVSPVTSVNGQIGDVVIPTPTLDSVLTEGNTSLLDAKVGRIGLRDTAEGDYGYLKLSENVFTISDYNDDTILGVDYNNIIKQNPTTGLSGTLNFTGITTSRVYTLPDENGEIALKSNIPTYTSQLTNNGSNGTNPFITALDIPTFASADKMVTVGRNSTGSTLYKGTIVYISGSTGNRPNFVKSLANGESTSAGTFGVIQNDIANNADGNCVTIGAIDNLDTRSNATNPFTTDTLVDGDTIYLSPTTAGYVTNVKPSAPNHLVYIGKVVRTSPTNGTIVYRIQNGYELDEIHDVAILSKTNNDIIQYDSATSLWKNRSLSVAGIQPALTNPITGTGTTNYLPKFTGASALGNSTIIQLANGDVTINGLRLGLGNSSVAQNSVFGIDAGKVISTGNYNSLFGYNAGISLTIGSANTFIGRMAGNSNSSGSNNTFIGLNAGSGNTTLSDCVSVGYATGYGTDCTFVGSGAGKNQSGSYNSYFGKNSGFIANANPYNSYFGNVSGENSTSTQNSFFGHGTGNVTTGANNTFLGSSAGQVNTSGNNNVYIGKAAGFYISGGSVSNALSTTSVLIGAETKTLVSGDTNEIVIGYNATGLGSNSVVLGNDSIIKTILKGSVAVGTTAPTSKLQVVGLVDYATNALAIAGGLTVGAFYHTAGVIKVVI